MSELLGVVTSAAVDPRVEDAVGKVLAHWPNALQQSHMSLGFATLGTVRLHTSDSLVLRRSRDGRAVIGWAGTLPPALLDGIVPSDELLSSAIPPFAGCLLYPDDRECVIITDPFGLQPLYYSQRASSLSFCTKVLPLIFCGGASPTVDAEGVIDLLTYEHVTGDRTLFRDIRVLPAGVIVRYRDGKWSHRRYNALEAMANPTREPPRGFSSKLAMGLRAAVKCVTERYERVAVTLSGGLDSRALLAAALDVGRRPTTYTFGYPGCLDRRYAAEVARAADVPHIAVDAFGDHLEEKLDSGIFQSGGNVSCMHYHILTLREILAREADVVLDGLGGDALTGGHIKWWMWRATRSDNVVQAVFAQRATGFSKASERAGVLNPEFAHSLEYDPTESIRRHFRTLDGRPLWHGAHLFDLLERQRRFVQYGPHLLRSAVSVETPFYAPQFVAVAFGLSEAALAGQRAYIEAHRTHWKRLATVPDSALGLPLTAARAARCGKQLLNAVGRRVSVRLAPARHNIAPTDYASWIRGVYGERIRREIERALPWAESIIASDVLLSIVQAKSGSVALTPPQLSAIGTIAATLRMANEGIH